MLKTQTTDFIVSLETVNEIEQPNAAVHFNEIEKAKDKNVLWREVQEQKGAYWPDPRVF